MEDHLYAHILLISASEPADGSFRQRLEELGHRVHSCETQGPALRDLLGMDIDLLVMDPGQAVDEESFDVIERLHDRAPTRWLPIGVLLDRDERWLRTCAWRAGADDVMDPQIKAEELDARVQRLVRAGRRQRELVARYERLRSLTNLMGDAMVVLDGTGKAEVNNEALGRTLDLDPDILRERGFTRILAMMGVPRETIERMLTTDSLIDDTVHLTVSGAERAVQMRCARLPIAADGRPAIGAVLRDVTEQRDQERQQADFHSMIAHDLRSPMSVIQGYLQLLDGEDQSGITLHEIVERIGQKVEEVSRLLDDFLDYSMLDAGFLRLEPSPIDVGSFMAEMEHDARMLAQEQGIEVEVDVDSAAMQVDVHGDGHRLRQVVQNLVGNALKYGADGGSIEIRAKLRSGAVRVSVTDQGPGVAPEDRELIFERYQRARRDRGDGRGLGLGLMIVRRIVEGHGGTVGVDSEVGKGSTFWFEIPPAHVQGRIATVIPTY